MATAWGSLESDSRAMAAALYHIYSGLSHSPDTSKARVRDTSRCALRSSVCSPVLYNTNATV